MNEFLYRQPDDLRKLRSDQLMGKLQAAMEQAVTQSDLDRLTRMHAQEVARAQLGPTAVWDHRWAISPSDLPQKALLEDFVARASDDLAALYARNAGFREQLMRAYNMVVGDLARAEAAAQKLSDQTKLLSLKLRTDGEVDYYTDTFAHPAGLLDQSTCLVERGAMLARTGLVDLTPQATVEILDPGKLSNGAVGNAHQVVLLKQEPIPTFGLEQEAFERVGAKQPHDKLAALTDGKFDTWLEYERYGSGPLRLVLKVDLQAVTDLNWLQVVPYLPPNGFGPALERVETSSDNLAWQEVPRGAGDLAQLNRQLGSIVQDSAFGSANVVSEEIVHLPMRRARYLKIVLRCDQSFEVDSAEAHYYRLQEKDLVEVSAEEATKFAAMPALPTGIQRRYLFPRLARYVIGLREIALRAATYAPSSELVTKPILARGGTRAIDRVSLLVDDEVPLEWWEGNFKRRSAFLRYFVSKDGGNTWLPITPDGSPYGPEDPPQFLSMGPDEDVRSLQVKAVLARPADAQGTPVVRRMALKMELR